jgi:peptidoglycan-associated lipoprotein
MMRKTLLLIAALIAVPASAQVLPFLRKYPPAGPPGQPVPTAPGVQVPIETLRADFAAQSGGTSVYFAAGHAQLTTQARTLLSAQALWLRQHPFVPVRIEGHGDPTDTRDHALALGAERAEEARDYLILLGVPAAQVTTMTWGKERPGPPAAVTTLVQ